MGFITAFLEKQDSFESFKGFLVHHADPQTIPDHRTKGSINDNCKKTHLLGDSAYKACLGRAYEAFNHIEPKDLS